MWCKETFEDSRVPRHHFTGTNPFIITDPTVKRNIIQQYTPYCLHVLIAFGTYFNYRAHTFWLMLGQEEWSIGKLLFPLFHYVFWCQWKWHGLLLQFTMHAVTANYFFTLSLMNHNAEHTRDVALRNASKDWGESQLHSSADWCVEYSFWQSMIFLWLNYHTIHHCKLTILFCLVGDKRERCSCWVLTSSHKFLR